MKLHINTERFATLITFAAEYFRISQTFIEKDYWITRALQTKTLKDTPLLKDFPTLWLNLRSTYQVELTPLAFSEIPDEKLIEESFVELMNKI